MQISAAIVPCGDVLGRIHDPAIEPLVRLCLAQSLRGRGRLDEALAELQLAIDAPALSSVERARFRAWASKCLMLLGRSSEAAARPGSPTADVARVDGRLRTLGVHRGRRDRRRGRPAHGWDALTRTELSVARLVSEGLSNGEIAERLFISPARPGPMCRMPC